MAEEHNDELDRNSINVNAKNKGNNRVVGRGLHSSTSQLNLSIF